MKHRIYFLLAFLPSFAIAQGYNFANSDYNINVLNTGGILHGAGVTFYDFNKDGLDDLTFCTASDSLIFYESTGTGFNRIEIIPNTLDMRQASWVDYDNDGDADLLVTKARNVGNNTKLYRNDGWPVFSDVTAQLNMPNFGGVRSYGQAWGDYDRDGHLDVYVCNYNLGGGITNWLFHNLGDGTFEEVSVTAGVDNGSRLSFQAAWQDFNEDGWLDLYVINDLDQQSYMYFNNQDGTFSDVSIETGTNIMIEAMCISIDDLENDGDWDIYVSNVADGNYYLINEGGIFSNQAAAAGLEVNRMTWGTTWVDYDNDGDNDVHMVTTQGSNNQNPFFTNNGDGTFTETNEIGFEGDLTNAYSNAKGDFNNDGFYDLIHSTVGSQNSYRLWENNGVGGNYVKVDLTGVVSNRDAIGSTVDYWIGGVKKRYFTAVGGGFLSQNAHTEIIGISEATQIDSIQIHWPRGIVEKHYNLQAGQRYDFTEGETFSAEITTTNDQFLCESLVLDAGEWNSYTWSDNSSDRYLTVTEPGVYEVIVTNEFNLPIIASIEIFAGVFNEFNATITPLNCHNDSNASILLSEANDASFSIIWEDESTDPNRLDLGPGEYSYVATSSTNCISTGMFSIENPDSLYLELTTSNVTCFGLDNGSAVMNAFGGTGAYTFDFGTFLPESLAAGEYTFTATDENLCAVDTTFMITEPSLIEVSDLIDDAEDGNNGSIELTVSGGTPEYTFIWSNGDEDALAENLGQGSYTCLITDANGCSYEYEGAIIDVNVSEIELTALSIYPNPSNDFIRLEWNKKPYQGKIELHSINGSSIQFLQGIQTNGNIDIRSLSSGMYVVKLVEEGVAVPFIRE
jgi:hypothetical protein